MPLSLEEQAAIAGAVADASRTHIMPRFRRLDAKDIATKTSSLDLVTEADILAEEQLRLSLGAILPEARVIGEEGVSKDPSELDALKNPGLAVVIDPVDGTWNFAHGLSLFGTIVAVIEDGETIYGLLYDPVNDDFIEASKGAGAWYVAGTKRTRLTLPTPPIHAEMTGIHSAYGLNDAQWLASAAIYPRFGRMTQLRASVWDYRSLVTGSAGFALNRYLNVWDHAAGVLALTEAGGHAALLDGTPYQPALRTGYLLAAQSETLWHEIAALFRPAILDLATS
ncbi:MAG: inositol monophosphatase [Pseudomonadota bacterium]